MAVSMMERHDEVVKLREEGLTYAKIGCRLSISRERVRQILKGRSRMLDLGPKVMLTVSEAAHILGIHTNTLRRWSEEGVLRPYRIGARGDRRYRREDIDNFLNHSGQ